MDQKKDCNGLSMNESTRASDQDTTLLEELLTIEFSPEEKERIGRALADAESMPARILMSSPRLIHDPKFWGRAQRKFGVNGFRPGAPAAIPKVVSRVLDAARSHASGTSTAAWPNIWPLYERAALAYIDHDRLALSRLLRKERVQARGGSRTDQILQSIVKCLPLYDVPIEHVRELYELWGFERTNLIEEILSDLAVRADTVRRMIDDVLSPLKEETLKSVAAERAERGKLLASYSSDLGGLRAEIAELRNDVEQARSEWRSTAIMIKAVGTSPEPGAQKEGALPSATSGPLPNSREPDRSVDEFETLHARLESLGKQLKDLRRRVDESERPQPAPKQPSTAAVECRVPPTPSQILQTWHIALVAAGAPNNPALAPVVLEIVRRSRVLLTMRPEPIKRLFASFPDAEIRVIAASPLWISDADWKDDFAYLQQPGTRPRLLLIENFDAALQDAYLFPPLLAWLHSVADTSASRVVLVPSVDDLSDVSPRVHEISTCLAHQPPHRGWPQFDEERVKAPLEVQSAADLVKFVRSTNPSGERELSQYLNNQNISLPLRLIQGFVNVYDGLRVLLPSREARIIAQDVTLFPWATCALGATQLTMLRNALDNLDEH